MLPSSHVQEIEKIGDEKSRFAQFVQTIKMSLQRHRQISISTWKRAFNGLRERNFIF